MRRAKPIRTRTPRQRAEKRAGVAALREGKARLAALHGETVTVAAEVPPRGSATSEPPRFFHVGPHIVGTAIEKHSPLVSETWLALVRAERCAICSAPPPNDPHHVKHVTRKGERYDLTAIPLCRKCHGERHTSARLFGMEDSALGTFLCRMLPRLTRSQAAAVLREMLDGVE